MTARIVVAAVLVLAAAAVTESLGLVGGDSAPARGAEPEARPEPAFVLAGEGTFAGDGRRLRDRVLRDGVEYLSAEEVGDAFPGSGRGLIDILRIAAGPDDTLALGVIRFPPGLRPETGVVLWRGREPVGAFLVEPGSFGGGIAFGRTNDLVALFSHDGGLRGVYDLSGRRLEDFPDRFLLGS